MKRVMLSAIVSFLVGALVSSVGAVQGNRRDCQPFPLDSKEVELLKNGWYPKIEMAHSDIQERLAVTVKAGTQGRFVYICR